jgi:outer membrane protein assembly factor BamA
MSFLKNHIILTVAILFLASCNITKKVPPGDALYTGASVKVDGPELSKKEKKSIASDLSSLARPTPNKKILGIRFKLFFYNLGLFKKKLGEPPVLLSDLNLEYNEKVLQSTLENQGFFQASVQGDTVTKKRMAKAIYTVKTGYQYTINEVGFPQDSGVLNSTIRETADKSFLEKGDPFNLDMIKGERERIEAYVKERGFYYFDPDNLVVKTDTTIGSHRANLYVQVKPSTPPQAKNVYRINDVFIYPNYRLTSAANATATDTLKDNAEYYKGYYVVSGRRKLYKPRLFEQSMQFDPGDVYSRTDHGQTLSRLVNLNLFKFVKNRFEVVPGIDTPKLNVYYYLTPFPKKSIRAEVNANTKSNNLTGSSLTLGWRNRNTFKGGELFSIDATGGFEVQYSSRLKGYNTYRGGIEGNLVFPRFLIPFFNIETKGGYVPKTNIQLGYDLLNKRKLYTMQSFRANFGYSWKETAQKEHVFNPIAINYVQPLLITPEYEDSAAKNRTLLKAVEKQFIIGSNYNYSFNEMQGRPIMSGGWYINGLLDLSGNILGLVTGANVKKGRPKEIFNAQFSQYVKFEADIRRYFKLSSKASWANRFIWGVGVPYGNSLSLPYIKQFFIGGTNSIRAFRSRSLGPGTYQDTTSTTFLPDQSGDIKLEFNTELRAKLFSIVHGALFIDAGNIWLYNEDPDKKGSKFTSKFMSQLAVGAGAGLRFDISFLVIRLDVAFPLRKPYLQDKQWVIDQIKFNNATWRKENIVFNLGIGYPF